MATCRGTDKSTIVLLKNQRLTTDTQSKSSCSRGKNSPLRGGTAKAGQHIGEGYCAALTLADFNRNVSLLILTHSEPLATNSALDLANTLPPTTKPLPTVPHLRKTPGQFDHPDTRATIFAAQATSRGEEVNKARLNAHRRLDHVAATSGNVAALSPRALHLTGHPAAPLRCIGPRRAYWAPLRLLSHSRVAAPLRRCSVATRRSSARAAATPPRGQAPPCLSSSGLRARALALAGAARVSRLRSFLAPCRGSVCVGFAARAAPVGSGSARGA
jgi:hypothetical protein